MLRHFCSQRLSQTFAPSSMRRLLASVTGGTHPHYRAANDPFEDFYNYTSGRFLFDEDMFLKERYKKFSVPGLKEVAAKAVSASSCKSITKLAEGWDNKFFSSHDGYWKTSYRLNPTSSCWSRTLHYSVRSCDYALSSY